MKILISLTTLFVFIMINACAKDESSESPSYSGETICEAEYKHLTNLIRSCNNSQEEVFEHSCRNTLEEQGTNIHTGTYYKDCAKSLNELTCEELNNIKSRDDFKNVEDCLVYPDAKKIGICVMNTSVYCNNISDKCGNEKLYGICVTSKHEYIDDEDRNKTDFKHEMIVNHCKEMANKDEKANFNDLLYHTCENYQIDCSNVQEFDFRNDDWKTQCLAE